MADTSPRDLEIEIVEEDSENKDMLNDEVNLHVVDDKQDQDESKTEEEEEDEDDEEETDARSKFANEEDKDGKSEDGDSKGNKRLNICTSSSEIRSIRSRVFVGHLHTDKATRKDLEKLFSNCGKVEAVSMLNGYGFVQFDNEESARKAIEKHHGTSFFGIRLGELTIS